MNKFLLATTALVASTSFAMADVDLSGSAEMGIFGGDGIEDQFHTDIDVTFSMSGETDGGLTFGASIDLDESDGDPSGAFGNSTGGGETIFVSGVYGTLTMGETDGALDWAMDEAIIGSSINDDHEHAGYNGGAVLDNLTQPRDGDQVARYDYAFGDFAVGISAEISDNDGDDDEDIDLTELDDDDSYGIGFTYDGTFGAISYGVGLGYQEIGDASGTGISASMSMDSGLSAIISYTDYDNILLSGAGQFDFVDIDTGASIFAELDSHFGLAVGYEFGSFLVAANYGEWDVAGADVSGIGLVANYDLGGGASLQGGYGYSDFDSDAGSEFDADYDTYSFGISMSF